MKSGKCAQIVHIAPRMTSLCMLLAGIEADDDGLKFREIPPMGPFPHDAPPAVMSADNPMGTDGFEFVEYAHPEPAKLHDLFSLMGFVAVARHKTKAITLYRQGDINYLVNEE